MLILDVTSKCAHKPVFSFHYSSQNSRPAPLTTCGWFSRFTDCDPSITRKGSEGPHHERPLMYEV